MFFSAFLFLIFGAQVLIYAASPGVATWDANLLSFAKGLQNPSLTSFFIFMTDLGNAPVIIIFGVAAAFFLKRRRAAVFVSAVVFAELTAILFKYLVARPRPGLAALVVIGYGFPSAHALVSTVFYGLLAYFICDEQKKRGARAAAAGAGAAFPFLIGLSRVYLGVHWPSDVLGGWLAGLAILILAIALFKKYGNYKAFKR